jgi:5-methylcytosine-specific restriction endonuclease McrA
MRCTSQAHMESDAFRCHVPVMLERLVSWDFGSGTNLCDLLDMDKVRAIEAHQRAVFARTGTFMFYGGLVALHASSLTHRPLLLTDGHHRYEAIKRIYTLKPDYKVCLTVIRVGHHVPLDYHLVDARHGLLLATRQAHRESAFQELARLVRASFLPFFTRRRNKKRARDEPAERKHPEFPMVSYDDLLDAASASALYDVMGDGGAMFEYLLHANARSGVELDGVEVVAKVVRHANKHHNTGGPLFLSALPSLADAFREADLVAFYNTRVRRQDDNVKRNTIIRVFGHTVTSVGGGVNLNPAQPSCLPKTVRTAVWSKHCGASSVLGKCQCCRRDIAWDTFDCGHVVSRANGGSDHLCNLVPLCGSCNRGMGRENLPDFVARYFA